MKSKLLLLLILSSISLAFGFGMTAHMNQAEAAVTSLQWNKYQKLTKFLLEHSLPSGTTYFDAIWQSAFEPDLEPLTDQQLNTYSSYITVYGTAYNFKNLLLENGQYARSKMPEVVGTFSSAFINVILEIFYSTYNIIHMNPLQAVLEADNLADAQIEELRPPVQHTYVAGDPTFGEMGKLTCAPYAAEAEYNLAKLYWPTNKSLALKHLSRTLHYVSDITVPHHNEIQGNIPDLEGASIETSSQRIYEEIESAKYYCSNQDILYSDDNSSIKSKTYFNDNYYSNDIPSILINIHNAIKQGGQSRYLLYCDGMGIYSECCNIIGGCNFDYHQHLRGYYYPKYMNVNEREAYNILGFCVNGVGFDDQMRSVSQDLYPFGVIVGTKIIAKFFHEVEGINRDPDISPILNLLLND